MPGDWRPRMPCYSLACTVPITFIRRTGSTVSRVKSGKADDSYDNFKRYLFHVFAYAATRSMDLDSDPVPIRQARAGDFFVQPGSPGHAVRLTAAEPQLLALQLRQRVAAISRC